MFEFTKEVDSEEDAVENAGATGDGSDNEEGIETMCQPVVAPILCVIEEKRNLMKSELQNKGIDFSKIKLTELACNQELYTSDDATE